MKRIITLIVSLVMLTALAGCAGSDYGTAAHPDTRGRTRVYQLDDGRRVTCLLINKDTTAQSMSCDWAHADGADRME